jgi:sugar phosphate isomerase/epimerase
LNNLELVESAGYDYIEPTVIETLIPEKTESEFVQIRKRLEKARIKPEAFNVFLPGDLKITGENVDFDRVIQYVATATRRAKLIGGEIIVFGSGVARRFPDGFPQEKALLQLLEFLHMAGNYAAKHEIIIALEPLHRGETNLINLTIAAVELVRVVNLPGIKVLVDLFHFTEENEPKENLLLARDELVHIHLAEPRQRLPPGTNNTYDYTPFFLVLKRIGYNARISIECQWTNFAAELNPAVAFIKSNYLTE